MQQNRVNYDKGERIYNGEKRVSPTNVVENTGQLHANQ